MDRVKTELERRKATTLEKPKAAKTNSVLKKLGKYKPSGLNYKQLNKYRTPLTPEERSMVMGRKAV